MADKPTGLEAKLNDLFVEDWPTLPDSAKQKLVRWAPIVTMPLGILTLLSAWSLWHWARVDNTFVSYYGICNSFASYGCSAPVSRFTFWVWLSIILLSAEGLLYILACANLQARKKIGWDRVYFGALLNAVYAVIGLFTPYEVAGHFIGALIGTSFGLYLLFQIRRCYLGPRKRAAPIRTTAKDDK